MEAETIAHLMERKRKWDVASSGVPEGSSKMINTSASISQSSPSSASTSNPAAAAQLAAQKINAMLASIGANPKAVEKEVDINEYKSEVRYYLCKGTTHDEIQRSTGTTVRSKGRYKPPTDTSSDRGLYLLLSAPNQQCIDAAMAKIQEVLNRDAQNAPMRSQSSHPMSPPATASNTCKVYIGMEGTDPNFDLMSKLFGPQGQYIRHISTTCGTGGCKISFCGVPTASSNFNPNLIPDKSISYQNTPEALHIIISDCASREAMETAKKSTEDLIAHIKHQYYTYTQSKHYSHASVNISPMTASGPGYYPYQGYYGGYYGSPQGIPMGMPPQTGPVYGPTLPPAPISMPYSPPSQSAYLQYGGHVHNTNAIPPPTTAYDKHAQIAEHLQTPSNSKLTTTPLSPSSSSGNPSPILSPNTSTSSNENRKFKEKVLVNDEFANIGVIKDRTKERAAKINDAGIQKSSSKNNSISGSTTGNKSETSKSSLQSLVAYEDDDPSKTSDSQNQTPSKPFWAAPSLLDSNPLNPLQQQAKASKDIDDLTNDVYAELGVKKN